MHYLKFSPFSFHMCLILTSSCSYHACSEINFFTHRPRWLIDKKKKTAGQAYFFTSQMKSPFCFTSTFVSVLKIKRYYVENKPKEDRTKWGSVLMSSYLFNPLPFRTLWQLKPALPPSSHDSESSQPLLGCYAGHPEACSPFITQCSDFCSATLFFNNRRLQSNFHYIHAHRQGMAMADC